MGAIRTAYKTQVRFSPDGQAVTVRWYRAAPKAKLFPGEHMGLSRYWFDYRRDVGEFGRKTYDLGPNRHNKKGKCFRGRKEWFRDGFTDSDLVGFQPIDRCTSCPGRGPRIGLRMGSTSGLQTWWNNNDGSAFLPMVLAVRVQGSTSGLSDGYWQFVHTDPVTQWFGRVGEFPNPVADLSVYFVSDIRAGLEQASGFPILQVGGALPWNPYAWAALVQNPYGDFDLTTEFSVNAALVVPHYFMHGRARIGWRIGKAFGRATIVWAPSGRLTFPTGPSGFSDGYSDGYGG